MLTTLSKVKDYLGIPAATTTDDVFLTDLIARASGFFEDQTDRKFEQATYTDEEYDGRDTDSMYTRQYPIISVTSVKIDDALLAATDYVVYKDEGRIRKKAGTFAGISRDVAGIIGDARAPGMRNVKISYTAGYAVIPGSIEQTVNELAKRKYQHRQKGDEGIISRTLPGGEAVTYSIADIWPEAKTVIELYRRKFVV